MTALPVPSRAAPAATASDAVRSFDDALLDTMQHATELGKKGRYDRLEPVVRQAFDAGFMTRMAVGSTWNSISPEQQQRATEAFVHYITATYADRFDGFSGEKFETTGVQPSGFGTVVNGRIVQSNGDAVEIDYLVKHNGDLWQIGDVYLTGTVSQLATLRSEFSGVITSHGIDGLIATLNKKAEILVASR